MANGIEEIVHVTIQAQDAAVAQESFDKILFCAYHDVGPELIRDYTDIDDINEDYADWPSVLNAASAWASQNPHSEIFSIGRLTTARAKIFEVTPVLANSQAYVVNVNGTAYTYTSDSTATLAEICAGIKSAVDAGSITGLTVTENDTVITFTGAAGTWYSLSVDRIDLLGVVETTSGTGLATELQSIFSERNDSYGVTCEHQSESVGAIVADDIEDRTKIYGIACPNADLLTSSTTDLGSDLQDAGYNRTFVMYHQKASEQFPEVAWMASRFPQNPGSETWRFKRLAGVSSSSLSGTAVTNAAAKNVNTVRSLGGLTLTNGSKMASGRYIDIQHGLDWLTARMEERIFSLLANNGKVPYTDAGLALLQGAVSAQLDEASDQDHQFLARDENLTTSVTDVATQASADRAARIVRGLNFRGRFAGAVEEIYVEGLVFP